MRAVVLTEPSSAPTLAELPKPVPGPGQILVHVEASSLNGFDIAVAAGMLQGMMEYRYPVVLGKDFAGVVEGVGENVSKFAIGEEVFGVVTTPYLGEGGFSEYLIVSEQVGVTKIPAGLGIEDAGALGVAGAAAIASIDAVGLQEGQTVLIVGATGGVGSIAIQYAVATGAYVIATARPGNEAEFVRSLGAHHVVDPSGDLAAQIKDFAPRDVDAILHFAGDASGLPALLKADGRIASTVGFGHDQDPRAIAVMANADVATLDRLAGDVASERVRVPITRTYDLAEVPEAIASFAKGTLGKLAVSTL